MYIYICNLSVQATTVIFMSCIHNGAIRRGSNVLTTTLQPFHCLHFFQTFLGGSFAHPECSRRDIETPEEVRFFTSYEHLRFLLLITGADRISMLFFISNPLETR